MSGLSSRLRKAASKPAFRLAVDNDLMFHLARSLFELRRYRGLTQEDVATRMGSTQPKVAKLEGGDGNPTAATISRFIEALDGRLKFEIEPSELERPRLPQWWDAPEIGALPGSTGWIEFRTTTVTRAGSAVTIAAWAASDGAQVEGPPTARSLENVAHTSYDTWESDVRLDALDLVLSEPDPRGSSGGEEG